MSAIVGIYYLDGRPVEQPDLEKMTGIVAHRGPDGEGIRHKGPVGLGHRMLWTTPESLHEELPLVNRRGDLVITADARIDNRNELIRTLGITDRRQEDITDSELILAAYEKWDKNCPENLIGDFAFVIWDERRRLIFCARDHMGVKPFYYYYSSRLFAFATEIKALLCLPEVPRKLNETKVADHLATLFEDKTITFYQDILRLPPAHYICIQSNEKRLQTYWAFDPSRNIRLSSDEEYSEAFREIFNEAVQSRLRSAFPVGSTLSGGLDSSSIACAASRLMSEKGNGKLHTFSAIFPDLPKEDLKKIDERQYMSAVLAGGEFVPHYVYADRLSPLLECDRAMWEADEAVLGPNLYMHRALYRTAQDHGVRIFLDGIDGDTTVSHGLEYLRELARRGKWVTFAKEASALADNAKRSRKRIMLQYGIRPLVPDCILKVWRIARRRNQSTENGCSIVSAAFSKRIGLMDRIKEQSAVAKSVRTARDSNLYGLTQGLNAHGLQQLDNTASSFLLEPRYPFFDRRLMEFCLALPPDQKLHMGWQRIIMRRAMDGILPREVQWRFTKANLSPNFTRRLIEDERKTLEGVIVSNSEIIEEYVDIPTLRKIYNRYVSDPMHRSQDAILIYGVTTLSLWFQQSGMSEH